MQILPPLGPLRWMHWESPGLTGSFCRVATAHCICAGLALRLVLPEIEEEALQCPVEGFGMRVPASRHGITGRQSAGAVRFM